VDASSSRVPTPPPSSPPPLESTPSFPSPPPTEQVEPSAEDFDTSWKRWREQVGEYGGKFVDSQEQFFMNHNLLMKELKRTNLRREIMEMRRLQVWKTCCGLKNVCTICTPTQKLCTSLGERGKGKKGGKIHVEGRIIYP
jgi:hypothetical protein